MVPSWVRVYRMLLGLLAVWAVTWDFGNWKRTRPDFDAANFWSLFTFQSNMIAGIVLVLGALLPAVVIHSRWAEMVRGASVMSMVTTGIVYATLLGGLFNPFASDQTWTNGVLHQLMPIVMVVDLVLQPPINRLAFRDSLVWTIYPLLFLAYSLMRGPVVDWYPYDFINPAEVGGYGGVAMYSVAILAGFLVIAALVTGLSRVSGRRLVPAVTPT